MNIKLKIALRYIFPYKNFNFISIITIVSIIGIAIGVSALIIVMSIFNGFRIMSESAILDIDPVIRITNYSSPYFTFDTSLIEQISNLDNVKRVNAILQTKAVIVYDNNIEVVELISNDGNMLDKKLFLLGNETNGFGTDINEIVLGIALSDKLKVTIFDTLKIINMASLKKSFSSLRLPTGMDVVTSGIIASNIKNYDYTNCYANYNIVRDVANVPDGMITQIDIFCINNVQENIYKLYAAIEKIIPKEYKLQTWIDLNKDLYSIMQMERIAVFCVISLILLIAIFNVFASLAMTVMEKKKEIALLKALGAENSMLTQIYIIEGFLIGAIGTIIGLVGGVGFVLGQINFDWIKLDSSAYITSSLPMELNNLEVLIICIFSLILSIIAAYFPSKRLLTIKFSD